MPVERVFATGAVSINYAESTVEEEAVRPGTSVSPLVLLHGGSARWQAFNSIIPDLSRHYHLFMPDMRGHGKSARAQCGYTIPEYADDIALFLAHVVKTPVVLYGHSLGGQVAITLAAHYPQLVTGLIIGDAPFDRAKLRAALQRDRDRLVLWRDLSGPGHSLEEVIEALKNMPVAANSTSDHVPARTLFGEDSVWFPYMAENLRLLDPAMLTAVIEFDDMHSGYDCEALFPRISCPVLIVQANPELGGGLSNEEVDRALALLSDASVVKLKTVGHALDHPDKEPLLRAISSFMEIHAISSSQK